MQSKSYKVFNRPSDGSSDDVTLFLFNGRQSPEHVKARLLDDGWDFYNTTPAWAGAFFQRALVFPMGSRTCAYLYKSYDV